MSSLKDLHKGGSSNCKEVIVETMHRINVRLGSIQERIQQSMILKERFLQGEQQDKHLQEKDGYCYHYYKCFYFCYQSQYLTQYYDYYYCCSYDEKKGTSKRTNILLQHVVLLSSIDQQSISHAVGQIVELVPRSSPKFLCIVVPIYCN